MQRGVGCCRIGCNRAHLSRCLCSLLCYISFCCGSRGFVWQALGWGVSTAREQRATCHQLRPCNQRVGHHDQNGAGAHLWGARGGGGDERRAGRAGDSGRPLRGSAVPRRRPARGQVPAAASPRAGASVLPPGVPGAHGAGARAPGYSGGKCFGGSCGRAADGGRCRRHQRASLKEVGGVIRAQEADGGEEAGTQAREPSP
mmetsp:Transcript_44689/g.85425  ORF Transcript_44689/g.85425 Transcript_44689/m.85425 type:complete len:201 (-) Transcript_44689:2107-2709(-)